MTARRIRLTRIPSERRLAIERFTPEERAVLVQTLAEIALAEVLAELDDEGRADSGSCTQRPITLTNEREGAA